MAVLHIFLINSTLIYILFSLGKFSSSSNIWRIWFNSVFIIIFYCINKNTTFYVIFDKYNSSLQKTDFNEFQHCNIVRFVTLGVLLHWVFCCIVPCALCCIVRFVALCVLLPCALCCIVRYVALCVLLHWVFCYIGCFVTLGVLLHCALCCIVRYVALCVMLHWVFCCLVRFVALGVLLPCALCCIVRFVALCVMYPNFILFKKSIIRNAFILSVKYNLTLIWGC